MESMDEREARFQRVRSAQEQRIAAESMNESGPSSASKECSGNRGLLRSQRTREACLQRVRSAQEQRIATESMEEREARLQHLRDAWQRRVTARRDRDREYHAQLEAVEPSQFHNPHIHLKMKEFHFLNYLPSKLVHVSHVYRDFLV